VKEMMRVTKPRGVIVLVDYALPRNAVGRALVYQVVKLYERERYAHGGARPRARGSSRFCGFQLASRGDRPAHAAARRLCRQLGSASSRRGPPSCCVSINTIAQLLGERNQPGSRKAS
jgi:hypothetical protein